MDTQDGLTYIGPLQDFPERFMNQALVSLDMKMGERTTDAWLEARLAERRRARQSVSLAPPGRRPYL